jgi:protein-L-isoaspartate(D-aspartate) O-methyltransferase
MTDFAAARKAMVDNQIRPSDVRAYPIIDAMLSVERERFVPEGLRPVAYAGEHLPLAPGRVLLDPRVMGKLLDALAIQPDEAVLDVGAALGYSPALIARLAGRVVAVEEDAGMAASARGALAGVDNAALHEGPLVAGHAAGGPYDVIIIEGAAEVVPAGLLAQLREGGRIGAILARDGLQAMRIGTSRGGQVAWQRAFDAQAPVMPGFAADRVFQF